MGWIDRLIFPLVGGNLERLRDRFQSLELMCDGLLQMDAARSDKADRVFEMSLRANVREEVAQATFAQQVNVQLQGAAEPRNANHLTARSHSIDGLSQRLRAC